MLPLSLPLPLPLSLRDAFGLAMQFKLFDNSEKCIWLTRRRRVLAASLRLSVCARYQWQDTRANKACAGRKVGGGWLLAGQRVSTEDT